MNIYDKIGCIGAWLLVMIPLLLVFIDYYQEYKKAKKKLKKFVFTKSSVTNESGMEYYIGDDIPKIRKSLEFEEENAAENCIKAVLGMLIPLGFIVYTIFFR